MNHGNKGFTIIELTLAMTFVSILLLSIAVTVIQISGSYNRGLLTKDINETARAVGSDLQRTIAASSPFEVSGSASQFVDSSWGGRLCTGDYTYVWNYGTTLAATNPLDKNTYTGGSELMRFARVEDPSGVYCANPATTINKSLSTELLTSSDHDLAVQDISITSESTAKDVATGKRLYYIQMYLGTNDRATINTDSLSCKQPGVVGADPQYCSVQKFSIVVSASNLGT